MRMREHLRTSGLAEALDAEAGPACALDAGGSFVFLNRRWDSFVLPPGTERATAGWLLGRRWVDSISGEQHAFFVRMLDLALKLPVAKGERLLHVSECNTPTLVRRSTTMMMPVRRGEQVLGCLVVYDLEPLGTPGAVYGDAGLPLSAYLSNQRVIQCGDCRRVLQPVTGAWHFVADALKRPELVGTFSTCATCRARYGVEPRTLS